MNRFFLAFLCCFVVFPLEAKSSKKTKIYKASVKNVSKKHPVKEGKGHVFPKKEHLEKSAEGFLSPYALLVDGETGFVMYEKDADKQIHPASMTKILTAYVVMDYLKQGLIKETTLFTVSEKAYKAIGSRSFLNLGCQVTVLELLKGLIIQSGNDAALTLAEGIAGSEEAFAKIMNDYAKKMGMKNSNFINASGITDEQQKTTLRDLYVVSKHIHDDFPQYYGLWSEKNYKHGDIAQDNRNPLLGKNLGCDGLKTGGSNDGGFGISATCKQNDRRIYALVNGLRSMNERAQEITAFVNYGFGVYQNYTLFKSNHVLDQLPVWYGKNTHLKIGFEKGVTFTRKRLNPKEISVTFEYPESLKAPIKKGSMVGKMTVNLPTETQIIDIVALDEVLEANIFGRLYDGIVYVFGGRKYKKDHKNQEPLTKTMVIG